ncbi:LamG-like jellyroll fold domain-containing protein [Galactobacter valiniphilus]|uniref:LamG-like jellyroll fold domain-containing protein n=1 Tax=Galactobacter valiniphilus TaxID=2676122 RepID=UPI00373651DB
MTSLLEAPPRALPPAGRRGVRRSLGLGTALALTVPVLVSGAPVALSAGTGPLVDYVFNQTSGTSVANSATGSSFGNATVKNAKDSLWTGTSLTFSGGAKSSTSASWVELPQNLLSQADSATVTTEVQLDSSMKSAYNFLWNIGNDASDAYFFSTVKDAPRTAITVGSAGGEVNARSTSNLSANRWYSLTTVLDGAAGTLNFYVNGAKVASQATSLKPKNITDQSLNTIGRSPWPDPFFKGQVAAFRVYDRALSAAEVATANTEDARLNAAAVKQRAEATLASISLPSDPVATDYLSLPTASGGVSWTSSHPEVISPDGTVTRPAAGSPSAVVTLTATASERGVTATKTFTLSVQPETVDAEQKAQAAADRYVLPPTVRSGEELPAAPAGVSATIVSATGATLKDNTLVSDQDATADVVVRAGVKGSEATVTKTFSVRVLGENSAGTLAAYDRTPTTDQEANNADVALSLHLARATANGWSAFNENYGIFFPTTSATVPAGGTSDSILRSLKDPSVFELEDGGYGVIATRVARGGGPDGTQTSQVLLATSKDLRSYTELGLLTLDEKGGVNRPHAVWDSAAKLYRISWSTDSGVRRSQGFTQLTTAAASRAASTGASTGAVTGTATLAADDMSSLEDTTHGTALTVPSAIMDGLEQSFGRISNTGYGAYNDVTVEQDETVDTAALPTEVELNYSDGSTASLPVSEWDLSEVDTSAPGEYTATGTVKQTEHPTPFADERADPSVFKYELNGKNVYLMIATNDLHGANVEQQNVAFMPVRMADTISGLSDASGAKEVKLLKRGDTDAKGNQMTGCFWAPEFHVIDGKLSILFMPCYNQNSQPNMWTGRASILQLNKDAEGNDLDPLDPASWTKAEQVLRQDGSDLNKLAGISLDMTYFEDETGQAYYAWQQLGAIFIAKVDPTVPTRLTSEPVRIVVPEYAWDNTIAEGPNVLSRDGKLYLIYSGSTVGDSYTTGLAMADASGQSDLTDAASWTKLNYPIQKSAVFNGSWQLGTGHGMWSEDEDGNTIYVFHARTLHNGLTGRDMFVRRVHFDVEGTPVFDMETREELAEPTVSLRVRVLAPQTGGSSAPSQTDSPTTAPGTEDLSSSAGPTSPSATGGAGAGSSPTASATPGAGPQTSDDTVEVGGVGTDAASSAPASSAGADQDLAQTGAAVTLWLVVAGALAAAGTALVLVGTRRRRQH